MTAPLRLELRPFVLPADLLPNRAARLHGCTTSRLRRKTRHDAARALYSAINGIPVDALPIVGVVPHQPRFAGPTHCRLTIAYEREVTRGRTGVRRYRQHADPDNLLAAAKPILDALQDVALIGNDRDLIHSPVEQLNDPDGGGWLAVELWQED